MKGGVQVYYSDEQGWIAQVPVALARPELAKIVAYVQRAQGQRVSTWPPGPRRDEAQRRLAALTADTLHQQITPRYPWEQDRILY